MDLASQFEKKDKESLKLDMTTQKLQEQVEQSSQSLRQLRSEKDVLISEKIDLAK